MLSQLRATRYTIMAIVMATGLMFAAPHSSHALPMTIEFEITVEDASGATAGALTGQFTGDDNIVVDNVISIDELTAITATWTPDPTLPTAQPAFDLGVGDLQLFSYATTPPPGAITELVLDNGAMAIACGPDPFTPRPCTAGESLFVFESDPGAVYTITGVRIQPVQTAIPEPGTWLLLTTGLVGMIGYAFSRRVRPVTTRQTPVAGA